MKTILKIQVMVLILCGAVGCTTDGFIESGISCGKHACSMLEYMEKDSYNWDSTLLMIHTAGLEELFDGNEMITFFGPTNHSIRRYMLQNDIERVSDMGREFCRTTLLRHVLKGKIMREEFPRGVKVTGKIIGTGGDIYIMEGGNKIWAYTFQGEYNSVAHVGAITLYVNSVDKGNILPIASTDIEPLNGVVHSLGYEFTLGEM